MYQNPEGVALFYKVRAFYITPSGFITQAALISIIIPVLRTSTALKRILMRLLAHGLLYVETQNFESLRNTIKRKTKHIPQ